MQSASLENLKIMAQNYTALEIVFISIYESSVLIEINIGDIKFQDTVSSCEDLIAFIKKVISRVTS